MTATTFPMFQEISPGINHPTIPLRDYQQEAVDAVLAAWDNGLDRVLMVLPTGCLAADTTISVSRANKGEKMSISHLAKRVNGHQGGLFGPRWNPEIETRVMRAEGSVARLGLLDSAWDSGIKETYSLTTETGRSIRATAAHPFLTREGWSRLEELQRGDLVQVVSGRSNRGKKPKRVDRQVGGMHNHPYAVKFVSRREGRSDEKVARVPLHRLVAESTLNGIDLETMISLVRLGEIDHLQFIDPEVLHVHHIDEDHTNNDPHNLRIMGRVEHLAMHGKQYVNNVLLQTGYERVVSIEPYGEEQTYDISVADDPHNFVANGFVVHNTGKTITFSEIIRRRLHQGPALIIAHRDELIEQAVDKYRMVSPGAAIGVVKAQRNELGYPITVASIQTIAGSKRLRQLVNIDWGTVVVDEAHHSTATTYMRVLQALGAFEGRVKTLGVTATPNRADKIGLHNAFEEIVYEKPLLSMILDGYLCDIRATRIHVPIDMSKLRVSRGDYQAGDLDRAMNAVHAEELIAKAVAEAPEMQDRKKIVAFTPAVRSAHDLSRHLTNRGVPATVVDGDTPLQERRAALSQFSSGEKRAIANCGVLTEGYDEPYIDAIVMARPTKSQTLYQQCIGRGLRIAPGKTDCLIVDMVGTTRDHNIVTVSKLVGKPLTKEEQKDSVVGGCGTSAGGSGFGMSLLDIMRNFGTIVDGDGSVVGSAIDLFGNSWAKWIPANGKWILPAGKTIYVIEQNSVGMWDVWERFSNGDKKKINYGLDLGYAQGIAEGKAKESTVILSAKDAAWRGMPVTQGQKDMFGRLRISTAIPIEHMTRGQASDEITVALAMKGWR